YRPHRVLHSFPTRRSSDLLTSHLQTDLRDLRIVDDKGNQVPYAIIDVKKFTETLIRDTPMRIWEQRRESGRSVITLESKPGINIDRKSTRLNSSHVKISHA